MLPADAAEINVLMYHSISPATAPTCIAPETFRMQMGMLAECGYGTVTLSDFASWRRGERELPAKTAVITFDDGFADFASAAHPVLRDHGFTATVFLPTSRMGGAVNWDGDASQSPLLSWDEIQALAEEGVEFGGHGLSHSDLTGLPPHDMQNEVRGPKQAIEEKLQRPVASFAPPYGRSTPAIREEIARNYEISLGVRFARARRDCDLFDVPRIEMFYYRDATRWRDHLTGRGETYFLARRFLRGARAALMPA